MRSDNEIKKDLDEFIDTPQNDATVELLLDIRNLLLTIIEGKK